MKKKYTKNKIKKVKPYSKKKYYVRWNDLAPEL